MCGDGWGCFSERGLELFQAERRVSSRVGMTLCVKPVRMNAGRMVDQVWIRLRRGVGSVGSQSLVMALRIGGRKRV